ncbi:MAG: hypothetical protein KKD92_06415 [Proteobacteria bacterium]|nr:hypothetical protein [Pseudomonadota bacterium]
MEMQPQLQWGQLVAFVIGIIFSYLLIAAYRKRYVPREYHRSFFLAMGVTYPFILIASWFLNLMIRNYLEFNIVVSFAELIILITLFSILAGRLGVYIAKTRKK